MLVASKSLSLAVPESVSSPRSELTANCSILIASPVPTMWQGTCTRSRWNSSLPSAGAYLELVKRDLALHGGLAPFGQVAPCTVELAGQRA